MKYALGLALMLLASLCDAGCENPASFKKCLGQTRAEVNICGINMTCKCLRQENVVRCYEKCGDDHYFKKLAQGEMGQQQIYCSQKRPGEPEDMPIIGSDGPVIKEVKKVASKPKVAAAAAAPPPAPPAPPMQQDWDYRNNQVMRGGDAGMVHNSDVEGSATRAMVNAGAVAVSLLAAVLFAF